LTQAIAWTHGEWPEAIAIIIAIDRIIEPTLRGKVIRVSEIIWTTISRVVMDRHPGSGRNSATGHVLAQCVGRHYPRDSDRDRRIQAESFLYAYHV
jgi:hypothetical protein